MKKVTNKFGTGYLYDDEDLKGSIYCICTACMSVYSEFLSWANHYKKRMVKDPFEADNIIVLSCQVTDLAVLNDIKTIEEHQKFYPGKNYYIGGCLAKRFDIELPENTMRLNNICSDGTPIDSTNLIDFAKPFWVKDFKEEDNEIKDGHLFRKMYPLRIGVGCKGKCTYCTIKHTRGKYKEFEYNRSEFVANENIVLIADNPSHTQLFQWALHATVENKPISIRNFEPKTLSFSMQVVLLELATRKLLKYFHSPIQHTNEEAIKEMKRSSHAVRQMRLFCKQLKSLGVITATNIIIDYNSYPNPDMELLKEEFDYISWNPYWDGNWDRDKAQKRFDKYIK